MTRLNKLPEINKVPNKNMRDYTSSNYKARDNSFVFNWPIRGLVDENGNKVKQ